LKSQIEIYQYPFDFHREIQHFYVCLGERTYLVELVKGKITAITSNLPKPKWLGREFYRYHVLLLKADITVDEDDECIIRRILALME
jgi:hypothetical protein